MVAAAFLPDIFPINIFLFFKDHLPGYSFESDCLLFDIFYSILVLLVSGLTLSLSISSCINLQPFGGRGHSVLFG